MCLPTQCYMCSNLSVVYRLPRVVLVTLLGMHRLGLLVRYVALWLQYSHSYPIVGLQETDDAALLYLQLLHLSRQLLCFEGNCFIPPVKLRSCYTIGLHCFN